jgi:ABC-type sugar transport system ATPase subunit
MSLCERIVTVKEGRITGNIPAKGVTEEQLMKRMALGADETHQRVEVEST